MRIKKLIVIQSILLGILLSACQPAVPNLEVTEKPESTAGPSREVSGLMCIIVPDVENPYFNTLQEAAAQKAEELSYTTLKLVHDFDYYKEVEVIDHCIAEQAVAIILENAGADDSIANVQKATDAGIPVFLIDREINESGIAVSQILPNIYQGAILAAEEFVRLMEGTGNYIELTGRDTDYTPVRVIGFHDIIDKYPDMEMVAQQTANWSRTEAYEVMEALIPMFPDIKGVICENDTMALGAMAALKDVGLGDVIVVGFDGFDEVIEAIKAGEIKATVMLSIERIAEMAVIQADAYLRTGSTGQPEHQVVDCELITAENADKYRTWRLVE